MPVNIYSHTFLAAEALSPGPNLAYLVPAGYTAVLRDIAIYTRGAPSGGNTFLYDTYTGLTLWFWEPAVAGGDDKIQWFGRQVFAADGVNAIGFGFYQQSTGTNTFHVRACGYLLQQP